MSARSHHNRARTTPYGYDYEDVLKRGKVFHRYAYNGILEMQPYETEQGTMWTAESETLKPFTRPIGTRVYKFDNSKHRWVEITNDIK